MLGQLHSLMTGERAAWALANEQAAGYLAVSAGVKVEHLLLEPANLPASAW